MDDFNRAENALRDLERYEARENYRYEELPAKGEGSDRDDNDLGWEGSFRLEGDPEPIDGIDGVQPPK